MDGGGGREEGPAMGSRNSISFAHRLQIILQQHPQHGDDLRATTSSLDHPHAYRPAPPPVPLPASQPHFSQ